MSLARRLLRGRGQGADGPGVRLDDWHTDAFALVLETIRRGTGVELHPVQIAIGAAMCEQASGKPKATRDIVALSFGFTDRDRSLAAALPAFTYGILARVHVMTVDDARAAVEAELYNAIATMSSSTVGLIRAGQPPGERHSACEANITIGSVTEFPVDEMRGGTAIVRVDPVQVDASLFVNRYERVAFLPD